MACKGIETRKQSWPELVGVPGTEAEAVIERENPGVDARLVKIGTKDREPYQESFVCNRVWVWVDESGLVARTPRVG